MRINDTVCRVSAQVDGTKYDVGPVKASEAERITNWTGYGLREWEAKLVEEVDPLAIKGLLMLFAFRAGEHRKFSEVEVEDMDTFSADLIDERGRRVTILTKNDGTPVLEDGKPVLLFDGEPDSPLDPEQD